MDVSYYGGETIYATDRGANTKDGTPDVKHGS